MHDNGSVQDERNESLEGRPSRMEALKLILGGVLASSGLMGTLGVAGPGSAEGADVLIGDLNSLPPGSATTARFHGLPVLVLNLGGEPVVLSGICTHEGCKVTWVKEEREILCPCHGGRFSAQGEVLEGPPPAPLLNLPVRVEDGKIFIIE